MCIRDRSSRTEASSRTGTTTVPDTQGSWRHRSTCGDLREELCIGPWVESTGHHRQSDASNSSRKDVHVLPCAASIWVQWATRVDVLLASRLATGECEQRRLASDPDRSAAPIGGSRLYSPFTTLAGDSYPGRSRRGRARCRCWSPQQDRVFRWLGRQDARAARTPPHAEWIASAGQLPVSWGARPSDLRRSGIRALSRDPVWARSRCHTVPAPRCR